MGKTQMERKNLWNKHNYDRITLMVKAGDREKLKAAADKEGISVNRLIIDSINAQRPGLLANLDNDSKKKKENNGHGKDTRGRKEQPAGKA